MHPLRGALSLPYMPRVLLVVLWLIIATRFRLLAVELSTAGPLCPSQRRCITNDPVFDGVGLGGFKSRASAFLLA